jgi:hypothetical protein
MAKRAKVFQLLDDEWVDRGMGIAEFSSKRLRIRTDDTSETFFEHVVSKDVLYKREVAFLNIKEEVSFVISFSSEPMCEQVFCEIEGVKAHLLVAPEDDLLKAPTLQTLSALSGMFTRILSQGSPALREQVCRSVTFDFAARLFEIFYICEKMNDFSSCETVFSIFRLIFLMANQSVYELLLGDTFVTHLIAALEYDPALNLVNHQPVSPVRRRLRQLLENSRLRMVVPLDASIISRIHHIYRVVLVRDVALLRHLDEPANACFVNLLAIYHSDLLSALCDDSQFPQKLTAALHETISSIKNAAETAGCTAANPQYAATAGGDSSDDSDDSASASNKPDQNAILFLREAIQMAKHSQPLVRDRFLRLLIESGLLGAANSALHMVLQLPKSVPIAGVTKVVLWN